MPKKSGREFFGEEQAPNFDLNLTNDFSWWTKERKSQKEQSKFRQKRSDTNTDKDCSQSDKGKFQKGKGVEEVHPQSGHSAPEAHKNVFISMFGDLIIDHQGIVLLIRNTISARESTRTQTVLFTFKIFYQHMGFFYLDCTRTIVSR